MSEVGYAEEERAGDEGGVTLRAVPHTPPRGVQLPLSIGELAMRGGVVPFVGLDREHARLADELRAAFERVTRRSSFILGEEVELFEHEFAAVCSARECVGVASGTAALTIALLAAGTDPGDEVVVPAHTFIASALAVVQAGATVVFCDVEGATGLIDAEAAAAAVSPHTAAIMAVHLYGQACDMDAVRRIAERHDLLVVEDAAQAHGATFRGRPAGSLGDVAAFSFYPSKNLGALGDGGAICTGDADIAARARRLRDLGQRVKGEHVELGFNERLDGLQAALLRAKLPHLPEANAARRQHAALYREFLKDELLLAERPHTPCVYHVFPIRVDDRDGTAAALLLGGVETGVHYRTAACDHPVWGDRVRLGGDVGAAREWAARELSLPMFPQLEEHEVLHAISACSALGLTKSTSARHVVG
jgi:dTDP-4-amino-4,6-dideoxygalactose transaminase